MQYILLDLHFITLFLEFLPISFSFVYLLRCNCETKNYQIMCIRNRILTNNTSIKSLTSLNPRLKTMKNRQHKINKKEKKAY